MSDELYDRIEALGEAHALSGEPEPWDDEYWRGVLVDDRVPAREEKTA